MSALDANNTTRDWANLLRDLTDQVSLSLLPFAVELLGQAGADLVNNLPPGLESYRHLQLVEHMLCEMWKISHPETRSFDHDPAAGFGDRYKRCVELKAFLRDPQIASTYLHDHAQRGCL